MTVKPKKHLGQHFLTDKNICDKIAKQYGAHQSCSRLLEIGPGMGALTEFLLKYNDDVHVMDIDAESIVFLKENYPDLKGKIHETDFLKTNLQDIFGTQPIAVVGNFPYNISSQILFKCLENRNQIPEIMGMFQKEVAVRVAEKPGSKQYGILSVLLQAFYDIHYCFTVDEHVFNPPPKVKSGVIRCTRNERKQLPCNEELFIRIVKSTFNQRRKTIRNSLKAGGLAHNFESDYLQMRPEQLSVDDFIQLTSLVEKQ